MLAPYTVLYRPGPAWRAGEPLHAQDLEAHGAYVQASFAAGRVLLGGPFLDDAGGLVVILAPSDDDARAWLAADPATRDGVFVGEVHPQHVVFDRYLGKGLVDPGPGV